ncbi:hypothetical protein ABB37_09192 [Leptomonas pyrrhocoris]|uniref:Uncharacterized protein n=1 Tax=Leptomonas pyrrhocoris TaxID=157538 RepID=A0A0M9FRI6_LEPPY|nr:hypothetical protein ABB37_09192 [Leptomonas pyrrhocoris]XP_015652983.1 hypothetical protein ABB37_09192 [Leptomonas pyrrhocoris]XP_015652984.1 hypothetical protein ABB37_09192 [Leptomonas pyrrhocoris]KPA74543.1 hypothetical protein ABB37_09192 [Leptomonas pyrrhocoris]KPA74544.1 hypothetical protein ABB37_09192 [Leptomonas pyrrhocoris]KPA74545.1 hypothetical protein ABB37_09192 [Leptomonas pyrrhocoris]|eukprot:XP_015652982.1 hypothetical protein ABB37_09192 [Leptomonas pyrrhocoris]
MPPASSASGANERERLHTKFAAAATALADLYRESSNSYEAGYRDALLFVQRYLQASTPMTSSQAPTAAATSFLSSSSSGLCTTVNAAQMMRFLQDTVAARRARMAVVRGVHSMRRRRRDMAETVDDTSENPIGEMSPSENGENDEEEEESWLTPPQPPSTRAIGPGPLIAMASPPATVADHADSTLNHAIELITHLEPRGPVMRTPLQPRRQRRRTDRTHGAELRLLRPSCGPPVSPPPLHVGRGT